MPLLLVTIGSILWLQLVQGLQFLTVVCIYPQCVVAAIPPYCGISLEGHNAVVNTNIAHS